MTVGKQYVVTVFEVDTESDTETTLIELRAPREMLTQFAPQAVAAALGTTAQDAEPPRTAMEGPAETQEQATQRRKRRTKAEMEAARMAEAAVSELAAVAQVGETADTVIESVPMPAEAPGAYNPFG